LPAWQYSATWCTCYCNMQSAAAAVRQPQPGSWWFPFSQRHASDLMQQSHTECCHTIASCYWQSQQMCCWQDPAQRGAVLEQTWKVVDLVYTYAESAVPDRVPPCIWSGLQVLWRL
jgi:hypothetical protein